jgi:arylsulfatase A-like enzyme
MLFHTHRLPTLLLAGVILPHVVLAMSININFYNSGEPATHTIPAGESAGLVPVAAESWNEFGFTFGTARRTLSTALAASDGTTNTATLTFDLDPAYVGNSGATGDPYGNRALMSSYIAWDPVDGTSPEDTGRISITGLGPAFTGSGYDVYVYFDADANNRTFTFTLNGTAVTAADSTTWNGSYRGAVLSPSDANVALFRGLNASNLTLMADSDTGRAAVNAIQIVADEPSPIESIQVAFHQRLDSHNAMAPATAPTAAGSVVDTAAAYWNSFHNSNSTAAADLGPVVLGDANALDSGATLSAALGYAGDNNNGWGNQTKDHVMMEGWFGIKQAEFLTVSNLPSSIATNYHVIVYGDSNNADRRMNYTLAGQTKTIQDSGTFAGDFEQGTHYIIFTNLSATSFTLTGNPSAGDYRSSVNGLQIAAGDPPRLPEIDAFIADDHYVATGATVVLSWDAPSFDTLTLDPGGVDAGDASTNGTGSYTATVHTTTVFTLTAALGSETTSRDLRVGVGPPRPNVVLFLVDDMGPHDTSVPFNLDSGGSPTNYNFNAFYVTPNMETLAANGMRFTAAYAQSVCSPTRCGILTGRNSARHGATDFVGGNDPGSPPNFRKDGIDLTDATLARQLQSGGYRTIHCGKAHYAKEWIDVMDLGFDVNIAGGRWGQPPNGYINYNLPGLEAYRGNTFLTRALTVEVNKALETAVSDDTPFFLNMCFYAVHSPFTTNPDATGDYSAAVNVNHGKFATMIEGMDIAVGEIRQKLIDLGVAEDTLVVFVGDNGSDSPATTQDGLPSGTFNDWPMRGKKGSKWEGGCRVPFIATWAAPDSANAFQQAISIPTNGLETDIVTTWDIPATLLDLAGLSTPANFGEDSHSLLPYFAATPGTHRPQEIVVHYPHEHRSDFFSWIRQGDMKLIYNFQNNTHQLYDIPNDPTESNDLSAAQPDTAMRLARRLAERLDATWGPAGVLLPTITTTAPTGNVVSIPDAPGTDIDNDGIPDRDEDPNLNGLVDAGETDPDDSDTDGDSTDDGAELRLGTDPLDPGSAFFVSGTLRPERDLTLTWPSKPGTHFEIRGSPDLRDWTELVVSNVPADVHGTNTTRIIPTDPDPRKFFRVGLK